MASKQKTARFAAVVGKAGRPQVHLTFLEAAKDTGLQSAIKAHRVMSVIRFHTGTKKDYGLVGHVEGLASQTLIFPKSLRPFEGRRIVGINYDLLAEEEAAPTGKPRKHAVKSARLREPRVLSKSPEPSLENPTRRAGVKRGTPRDARKAVTKAPPVRAKIPKPPRLTLRETLEAVLKEWEDGDAAAAKSMLRTVVGSLPKKRQRRGKCAPGPARGAFSRRA